MARSPAATPPQAPGRWPPRGPVRVLVVHDYRPVVELIRLTLNHGAYATETADTPEQAVSILEGWEPHLAQRRRETAELPAAGTEWCTPGAASPQSGR